MAAHDAYELPAWLNAPLETWLGRVLQPPGTPTEWYASPPGEPALLAPDTVTWRLFKNPVALFIGGVGAVLLELAEPRVRTGVWEYTSFRERPVQRLQRTALSAMLTVYGPRSRSTAMIASVARLHERIAGVTPGGVPFRASDPELLDWVHATAAFGILEATHVYVRPLSLAERDRFYAEGRLAARLYGAHGAPASQAQWDEQLHGMEAHLEGSQVVYDFLRILGGAPALPAGVRPLQRMLLRAGVEVLPPVVRERLRLGAPWRLGASEWRAVTALARALDRVLLRSSPAVQACRRLGLPDDYLYRDPAGVR
jgi:uncharacterized protein (DUF2236 family)